MKFEKSVLDLIKLGAKLVYHKILQYRLTTNVTEIRETANGKLMGVKRLTVYDDAYYAFEGIPYAKPPLGELRFRAPVPAEPWQGVLNCTKCKDKPIQKNILLGLKEGAEDCLYLNVYAKQLNTENPLPVMVWIYGGGFQVGEATRDCYSPDYFMREDVILVTVNYRLGALGFLSLCDPDLQVPGNAGLKDQVLALRWIKENISHFNGDANNITLFGESAGSASTHYMMLTQQTRGLFHKAILQSGTALNPWALMPDKHWAYRLASELGFKGSNNDKAVFRFLSELDGRKFTQAFDCLLTSVEKKDFDLFSFTPVVEPYLSSECVLPKAPLELMRTTWSNEIPVIMGGCSYEGLFSYSSSKELLLDMDDCERLVPLDARLHLNVAECKNKGLALRQAHFGENNPNAPASFEQFLDVMSYKNFWHGIHRTLCSRLAYAAPSASTYLYRFDFDSPDFNQYRTLSCGRSIRGVCHADDLSYLFYCILSWKLDMDSAEFKTIDRMISMWTTFAKSSDPNCVAIASTRWQPASQDDSTHKCLNISKDVEFIDLPEMEKLRVWDSLYKPEMLY